jgi:hypothetical protein
MGLFNRQSVVKADPDQLKRWRGRAAELSDAGPMPWQIVLEALKTTADPRPGDDLDYPAIVMTPLGLRFLKVDEHSTNIFHGQRYGRPVRLNQGNQRPGQRGAMVTWVGVVTAEFSVTASDGRLTVADTAPLEVVEAIRALSMQPRLWSKVHLIGGPEGILVRRSIHTAMHPQGWIYDLWLAELAAHLAEYATLPTPDPTTTFLPYQLDHTPTW